MDFLLYVIHNMFVISIVILAAVFFRKIFSKQTGYRWCKILWLLLAIKLLIPIPVHDFVRDENIIRIELEGFDNETVRPGDIRNQVMAGNGLTNHNVTDSNNLTKQPEKQADMKETMPDKVQNPEPDEGIIRFGRLSGENIIVCLMAIWFIVMFVMLNFHRLQYQYIKKKYLDNADCIENDDMEAILWKVTKEFGIRRPIKVLECDKLKSPMVFGYFHSVLILPKIPYSEEELEMVLRHELNHYRTGDIWYKLLMVLVSDLYWFNPVILLMKNIAFADTEYVCDEKSVYMMSPERKKLYCNTILKTLEFVDNKSISLSTQFAGGKNCVKKRFENILSTMRNKWGIAILMFLFFVALAGTSVMVISSSGKSALISMKREIYESDEMLAEGEKIFLSTDDVGDNRGAGFTEKYLYGMHECENYVVKVYLDSKGFLEISYLRGKDEHQIYCDYDWSKTASTENFGKEHCSITEYKELFGTSGLMIELKRENGISKYFMVSTGRTAEIIFIKEAGQLLIADINQDGANELIAPLENTIYYDWENNIYQVRFLMDDNMEQIFFDKNKEAFYVQYHNGSKKRVAIDIGEINRIPLENHSETEIADDISAPSGDEVRNMREKVLSGMSEEERTLLKETIKYYNLSWEEDYVYGNYFYSLRDVYSREWNQKYHSKRFLDDMQELLTVVKTDELRYEIQKMIDFIKMADETHDVDYIIETYHILHDMDYYLLRYSGDIVTQVDFSADVSTIMRYYGALSLYHSKEDVYEMPVMMENVRLAYGKLDLANGNVESIELWMVQGAYFMEEYAGSSVGIYPENYQGYYVLKTIGKDGSVLSERNCNEDWNEVSGITSADRLLNFGGNFIINVTDYNDDACPDFTLGQAATSSVNEYVMYTVKEDGKIELLCESVLLNTNKSFSLILNQTVKNHQKCIIETQWNNAFGKEEENYFYWNKESNLYERMEENFYEKQ